MLTGAAFQCPLGKEGFRMLKRIAGAMLVRQVEPHHITARLCFKGQSTQQEAYNQQESEGKVCFRNECHIFMIFDIGRKDTKNLRIKNAVCQKNSNFAP